MNSQQLIKEKIQALQQITQSNDIELDNIDLNEFTVDNDKYYIVLNEQELQTYFFEFLLEMNITNQLDGMHEEEKLYIINNCIVDNEIDWKIYTRHEMDIEKDNRPQLLGWVDNKEYTTIVNGVKYYAYLRN